MKNVTKIRYFGAILTNQNFIHGQCKRLSSENAYYHLVQNFLSSDLLSQNIKAKIYRTVIIYITVIIYRTLIRALSCLLCVPQFFCILLWCGGSRARVSEAIFITYFITSSLLYTI